MTTEVMLFVLRLASGTLLVAVLVTLFWIVWRDFRRTASHLESRSRSYGQLIVLREIDGHYLVTGEQHPLLPITSLGRAPTNTIPISDTFASSEHALVAMRDGQWWLEDRRSRNGTTLNDVPITQSVVVTHGDTIGIGSLKFRIELER